MNGLAGGLSLRSPSMVRTGAEAGAWAASGLAKMARAVVDTDRPLAGRMLEGGSGGATVVAAGLSVAALVASGNYSLASTAVWVAADGLSALAVAAGQRASGGEVEADQAASA
jgi:hypothetical protein